MPTPDSPAVMPRQRAAGGRRRRVLPAAVAATVWCVIVSVTPPTGAFAATSGTVASQAAASSTPGVTGEAATASPAKTSAAAVAPTTGPSGTGIWSVTDIGAPTGTSSAAFAVANNGFVAGDAGSTAVDDLLRNGQPVIGAPRTPMTSLPTLHGRGRVNGLGTATPGGAPMAVGQQLDHNETGSNIPITHAVYWATPTTTAVDLTPDCSGYCAANALAGKYVVGIAQTTTSTNTAFFENLGLSVPIRGALSAPPGGHSITASAIALDLSSPTKPTPRIVGQAAMPNGTSTSAVAVLWPSAGQLPVPLFEPLTASTATAIAEQTDVTGLSDTPLDLRRALAVGYGQRAGITTAFTVMVRAGVPDASSLRWLPAPSGSVATRAWGVNAHGDVVGEALDAAGKPSQALLWRGPANGEKKAQILSTLAVGAGWDDLTSARSINNAGEIAGIGHRGDDDRGFLLRPPPIVFVPGVSRNGSCRSDRPSTVAGLGHGLAVELRKGPAGAGRRLSHRRACVSHADVPLPRFERRRLRRGERRIGRNHSGRFLLRFRAHPSAMGVHALHGEPKCLHRS